jgi:hypothetical protein
MYVVAPLIAFAAIVALAAVLRWTFDNRVGARFDGSPFGPPGGPPEDGPSHSGDTPLSALFSAGTPASDSPPAGPAPAPDFGLLTQVATVEDANAARALQRVLAQAGIRSTTAIVHGKLRVLVFQSDLTQARRLAG